jgi:PAS domain S-box-containing protein
MNQDESLPQSYNQQETYGFLERLKTPALWLVILMYVLVVVFYLLGINAIYNSTQFILVLNIIFVVIPSLFIAFIAARSFLRTGNWPVLWMGVGTLSFGLAVLLSYFIGLWFSINASSTNFPIVVLIAGLFYFFASLFLFSRAPPYGRGPGRLVILLLVNIGVVALITIITLISIQGILPPFFIQGQGSTAERKIILVAASFLFLLSGLIISQQYMKSKSFLLYWYALGLLLLFLVIVGNLLVITVGTPINWTLRITQLLGGVYLFIAALVILKEAKIQRISAGDALASFFSTSKSTLDKLLNNVTDAIIVSDQNFNIIGWNAAAENIYGWKAEDALGNPAMEFLQTRYPFDKFPPDLSNERFQKDGWKGEILQKHKDGQIIPIMTSISPLKDENNVLTGTIEINRDITKRKEIEDALHKSESNLAEAQRIAHIGSWEWNIQNGEIIWSDELYSIYGLDINTFTPTMNSFADYVHPDDLEYVNSIIDQITSKGIQVDFDFRIVRTDGSTRILNTVAEITDFDENNNPLLMSGINQDITERKQTEEQFKIHSEELAKSNADLKQFAYVASHDLREPLRMITSYLQLLERRYKDQLDEDANDFIGFAVNGAKRLDTMIMDLLEYSRVANIEMKFTDVDIQEVVELVINNLKVLIEENDATIDYDSLPTIWSDENLLIILFQNLISNAIKYRTEETPKIHISAIKEENQYVFSVKDNGIGIDSKHLERIFTIFNRLHTHEEYEGSGIGLAIAQRIVHQHGGEIWAESELGKGSTFYFTIPETKREFYGHRSTIH